MKMKNMHICIYMYIWINVDIWIFLKRMMKACLSLSFAVVHSRHVFRHNKHNNMHVCIQTSVKRMMKACIPLWLAIFHSEHVVHVGVCVCLYVCVSCAARTRDRWSRCSGSMSISCSASARRGGGVCGAEIGSMQKLRFVFSCLTNCMFLRVAKAMHTSSVYKKTWSMIVGRKITTKINSIDA